MELAPVAMSPTLQPFKPQHSASMRHGGTFGIGETWQVPASVPRVDGRSDEDGTVNSPEVALSPRHNSVTSVWMPAPCSASPSNICSQTKGRSPFRLSRSITNGLPLSMMLAFVSAISQSVKLPSHRKWTYLFCGSFSHHKLEDLDSTLVDDIF